MAPPTDVWIRVLGMSVLFFGFYYIQAGRHNLMEFFRWTIYGRYAVPLFFIAERMFCFVILSASSRSAYLLHRDAMHTRKEKQ